MPRVRRERDELLSPSPSLFVSLVRVSSLSLSRLELPPREDERRRRDLRSELLDESRRERDDEREDALEEERADFERAARAFSSCSAANCSSVTLSASSYGSTSVYSSNRSSATISSSLSDSQLQSGLGRFSMSISRILPMMGERSMRKSSIVVGLSESCIDSARKLASMSWGAPVVWV